MRTFQTACFNMVDSGTVNICTAALCYLRLQIIVYQSKMQAVSCHPTMLIFSYTDITLAFYWENKVQWLPSVIWKTAFVEKPAGCDSGRHS